MVVIRKEQMKVFDEQARQTLIDEVVRDLVEHNPRDVAGYSHEQLRRLVAQGLERAAAYGFHKKFSLSLFIEMTFLAAPNFDEYPPIRYILSHPGIPADERMDRVVGTLRDAEWEEVRRRAGRRQR